MDEIIIEFIRERLVVTGKGTDRIASSALVALYIDWYEAKTARPIRRRSAALAIADAARNYHDPDTSAVFASMTSQGITFYTGVKLA